MALPDYSMRQLLEAGVHFGHQAHRWNPKMGDYIFGTRNNIHIIDLAQSVPMLHKALTAVSDVAAKGGLKAEKGRNTDNRAKIRLFLASRDACRYMQPISHADLAI